MSNNKFRNSYSESLNAGVLAELEIDLATQGLSGKNVIDIIGFGVCSVTIQATGATGSSGNFKLLQANEIGSGFPFQTPVLIPISENSHTSAFDIPCSTAFIILDHSEVTLGTVGRLKVKITAKRGGASGVPYISSVIDGTTSIANTWLYIDGNVEIHDNITTGGTIPAGTCVYCKVENIGSGVAIINGNTGQINLQPGESFYEEMQKLDKVYKQAKVDYNPNGVTTLRITKKLIA